MALTEAAAAVIGSIGAAALTSGASVSSGLFGKKKAKKYNSELQKEQFEYNQKLAAQQNQYNRENAEWAYQKNLEQWQRENEYNSPAAQMRRYQEAGLNPNLAYGQSNTAASSPTISAPTAEGYPMSGSSGVSDSMPSIEFPNVVQEYMNLKTQKLQQDQIQQSIDMMRKQADNYSAMSFLNTLKGMQLNTGRPYWSSNARFDNMAKEMSLNLKQQQFENMLFNNNELNPIRKALLNMDLNLKNQNYHFQEEANPLKLLQMKLFNNQLNFKNHSIDLDNFDKEQRNVYSDLKYMYDALIKQNINFKYDIENGWNSQVKKTLEKQAWNLDDFETFLRSTFSGWHF